MKVPAFVLPLLLIVCSSPKLLAQSNPSQTAPNNAALKRWVETEKKLATEGNVGAEETLGGFYYFGIGVPQDYPKAAYWLQKAAEQGDANAQFEIGDLYFKGQGVPQSYSQAYFWLDLAAASASPKNPLGQMPLAEMRDEAASHLTRAELSQVQKRAEGWFESRKAKSPAQ
ncbi:MAG: tetratricopeptide repeat protein [Terracidiphilus sp.]